MTEGKDFNRRLGIITATTLVVGSMIGSGIFIVPSILASYVQSPGILVGLWIFGGFFTILGALCYAELAAMSPKAGGQYVFLKEAFGPFWAFLYGWTLFLIIQTGFNAAVSIAFAKYLGYFYTPLGEDNVLFTWHLPMVNFWNNAENIPGESKALFVRHSFGLNSAQFVACGVIIVLTIINILSVKESAFVQNLFTLLKVSALVGLIVAGLSSEHAQLSNFAPLFELKTGVEGAKIGLLAALAVALSKTLFTYDAWNNVTFVAEEVKSPEWTLPRALLLGCLITTTVYVLTNISYIVTLSVAEMTMVPENRVAQAVALRLFGQIGIKLIVVAILISTFGCVNGLILGGARVCYAMARDGLFFRSCGYLHPRWQTPAVALIYQGVWSCILALSGSYNALLTYTTFASILFSGLTVAGVFRLRALEPDRYRPYRCWGYPWTPALYLLITVPFVIYVIQGDPLSTLSGVVLVMTGIPVYFWWQMRKKATM